MRELGKISAAAVACVLSLAGCVVGPRYHKPSAPTPAAPNYKESPVNFQDAEGWKVASPQDAMLQGNWWEVFQQPELNELEAQLNINNQNIKVYFENYLAARALIREARAQYYPTVSVGAGVTRSRITGSTSTAGSGGTLEQWRRISRNSSTPLDISWAPDLFGRVRNTVQGISGCGAGQRGRSGERAVAGTGYAGRDVLRDPRAG